MDTDGMRPPAGRDDRAHAGAVRGRRLGGRHADGPGGDAPRGRPAAGDESAPAGAGVHYFESLGVAVVDAPPEQVMQAGVSAAEASIAIVEPERIVYALEADAARSRRRRTATPAIPHPRPAAVPRARAAAGRAVQRRVPARLPRGRAAPDRRGIAARASAGVAAAIAAALDESQATWGLQATKVVNCCRTGTRRPRRGARHRLRPAPTRTSPGARSRRSRSSPARRSRTATATARTASARRWAPSARRRRPRYGVAYEAEIFAGKVLSNAGSGADAGILAGIEWALAEQVRRDLDVARRAARSPGQPFSQVFERVAQARAGRRAR